jgi:hypothetical protein
MSKENVDPKSGGLGADRLSSVDLIVESHRAVREVLLALEKLALPAAANTAALDELRGKAQAARRQLEDADAELDTLRKTLNDSRAPV